MTSTSSIILSILPLILFISLLVFFIRRHTRKKRKEKINHFNEACKKGGFQIDYFMERKTRMAALSLKNNQVALARFTNDRLSEVSFLPLDPAHKQTLKIKKNREIVQEITIHPPYKGGLKKTPGIVFFNVEEDDMLKVNEYMNEAKEWEKALNQCEA